MSMLESKTDIRKEWLVRTKTREVIGPFTQSELYSALNSHLFTLEDEIAQSGGFWVSAQALSYREEDDFTRTSTRSQVVAENTQTGSLPELPVSDELTPTPEFIPLHKTENSEVLKKDAPSASQTLPVKIGKPRVLRIAAAVVVLFLVWVFVATLGSKTSPISSGDSAQSPENGSALQNEIMFKIRTGDTRNALNELTQMHDAPNLKVEPELTVLYGALLITEKESLERARRILRAVADSSVTPSTKADALMWLGYSHLVQDKDSEDRAEGYLLESLQLNPKSAPARYNLGRAYFRKGKYLAAIDYLQLAELELPDLWLIHIQKGNARTMLGQKEDAKRSLRAAIDRAPDRWYPYLVYAAYLNRNGEHEEAGRTLRTMFTKDPTFEAQTPAPFGFLNDEINYSEYLAAYLTILKDSHNDDKEFGKLYLSYLNGFGSDDAAHELKRLEKLADKGHFLARILSLKISTEHFIDENTLQQRLQRVPSDVKQFGAYAYFVRAEASLRLGRTDAAMAELEKALQVDSKSATSRLALAQLLFKAGEREKAKSHLSTVLEFHPDYIPALLQSSKW